MTHRRAIAPALAGFAMGFSLLLAFARATTQHAGQRLRRGGAHVAAAAAHGPAKGASRLSGLLEDVGESVQRVGEDAELVFTQLYGYDQHLQDGLEHEIGLLSKTLEKLGMLQTRFRSETNKTARRIQKLSKAHIFLQQKSDKRSLAGRAAAAAAAMDAARVKRAEVSRRAEEAASSTTFTEAVLELDRHFLAKVQQHVAAKAHLVEGARAERAGQLKSVKELVDLIRGDYSAPQASAMPAQADAAADADADADAAADADAEDTWEEATPSFVQIKQEANRGQQHLRSAVLSKKPMHRGSLRASALQTEIETTLQKKGDTHAILLRVQKMLEKSKDKQPIQDEAQAYDSSDVRAAVTKLGSALRSVDCAQAMDDATKRCEGQRDSAVQEEKRLQRNLALLTASRNRTQGAIRAARLNLEGISLKSKVLNKSAEDLVRMNGQAKKVLVKQQNDRATVIAAVRKAEEVAPSALGAERSPAAVALLQQLLGQLETDEKDAVGYWAQQEAMAKDLASYAQRYRQLLEGRRQRYEAAVASLELYASELATDTAARSSMLRDDDELRLEGTRICDSIEAFYKRHGDRRLKLSSALRHIIPTVPEALGSP